jgi:hypothetical protein
VSDILKVASVMSSVAACTSDTRWCSTYAQVLLLAVFCRVVDAQHLNCVCLSVRTSHLAAHREAHLLWVRPLCSALPLLLPLLLLLQCV